MKRSQSSALKVLDRIINSSPVGKNVDAYHEYMVWSATAETTNNQTILVDFEPLADASTTTTGEIE